MSSSTPATRQSLASWLGERLSLLNYFLRHSGSVASGWRMFYLGVLKRSFVHRGLAKHRGERVHEVTFKPGGDACWRLRLRDNQLDAGVLVEFFAQGRLTEFERLQPSPRVIYDLGANIGVASLMMARGCPDAEVVAFEPEPGNFKLCEFNLKNLPRATVFPLAVGRECGSLTFEVSGDDLRGGRLANTAESTGGRHTRRFIVEVWSVAELVAKKKIPSPDLLKVDVEGAEMDVLNGLGGCVRGVRYIHLETHSDELERRCTAWLDANGFKIESREDYGPGLAALWAVRKG